MSCGCSADFSLNSFIEWSALCAEEEDDQKRWQMAPVMFNLRGVEWLRLRCLMLIPAYHVIIAVTVVIIAILLIVLIIHN